MKLIIEVCRDNSSVRPPDAYDRMRVSYLEAAGYNVLRFDESEVSTQSERIVASIRDCIGMMHPTN